MQFKDLYAVLCIESVENKKMRVFGKLERLIKRRHELIQKGYSACILVNTREHSFDYVLYDNEEFEIPESGWVLQLQAKLTNIGYSGGIKFSKKKYKPIKLPPKIDGVYWIISSMVAKVINSERKDIVLANTVKSDDRVRCNGFVILNV